MSSCTCMHAYTVSPLWQDISTVAILCFSCHDGFEIALYYKYTKVAPACSSLFISLWHTCALQDDCFMEHSLTVGPIASAYNLHARVKWEPGNESIVHPVLTVYFLLWASFLVVTHAWRSSLYSSISSVRATIRIPHSEMCTGYHDAAHTDVAKNWDFSRY